MIIPKEVTKITTETQIVYRLILINAKLRTGKRGQNRADWEKSIKETKVRIGL
jgi:hypothetical protein